MLVKQPNGFLTEWSFAFCDFVEMNVRRDNALRRFGRRAVEYAFENRDPLNLDGPRNWERWKRCMDIIEKVHGVARRMRRDSQDAERGR